VQVWGKAPKGPNSFSRLQISPGICAFSDLDKGTATAYACDMIEIFGMLLRWTDLSFVLSQSTRSADGQTDERTDRQLSHR